MAQVALRELETAGEPLLVSCIIAVIAMAKGQFTLGRFAVLFDEIERKDLFDRAGYS